jgi:hypothetical protein
MDPISMASSAMDVLAAYKAQLDQAVLVYEDAKQLLRSINTFEVTVSMIPPRGDQGKLKEMTGEKEDGKKDEGKKKRGSITMPNFDASKYASQAVELVQEKLSDQASDGVLGKVTGAVGDLLSTAPVDLGTVSSLIEYHPTRVARLFKGCQGWADSKEHSKCIHHYLAHICTSTDVN